VQLPAAGGGALDQEDGKMGYDGEDVTRMMANGLLKTAATFAKAKSPEVLTGPTALRTAAAAPQAAAAPVSLLPGAGPSVISLNVEMTGSITTPDELHIYGAIDGNVRASSLIVCKGGMVRGEVIAESVVIHGSVEGSIQGEKVQLLAGASVRGDIVHGVLGVDPAAMFEGAARRIPARAIETPVLAIAV
jgi:cytoskeletal protein CcmA (bactofilin family)